MERILVSACLLGERVRYNGGDAEVVSDSLDRWRREGRLIPVCPEVAGGLPVPRPAAEILCGDAAAVLAGMNQVVDILGHDVTEYFLRGAATAVRLARQHDIRLAVLKDGSPSCAATVIHDGSFIGTGIPGRGITALLLEQNGVRVFAETALDDAARYLQAIEHPSG